MKARDIKGFIQGHIVSVSTDPPDLSSASLFVCSFCFLFPHCLAVSLVHCFEIHDTHESACKMSPTAMEVNYSHNLGVL